MAHSIETSIDQVLGVLTCLRTGYIREGVSVNRELASDGQGRVLELIAIGKGAGWLSGDPTINYVALERNPNRLDRPEGSIVLTLKGRRNIELFFKPGERIETGNNTFSIVETVLANIIDLRKSCIDPADIRIPSVASYKIGEWSNN